jgi:hypothetical protein
MAMKAGSVPAAAGTAASNTIPEMQASRMRTGRRCGAMAAPPAVTPAACARRLEAMKSIVKIMSFIWTGWGEAGRSTDPFDAVDLLICFGTPDAA